MPNCHRETGDPATLKKTVIVKSGTPHHKASIDKLQADDREFVSTTSKTAETDVSKKGKLPSPYDLVMDLNTLQLTLGDLHRLLSYPQLETPRSAHVIISPESLRADTQNLSSSSESSFELGPPKKKIFCSRRMLLDEDSDDAATIPHEVEIHPLFEAFLEWHVHRGAHACVLNFPIPTMMRAGVTHLWFDPISNPDGWLANEHIDAILSMLVLNCNVANIAAIHTDRRYSIVDTACWGALKQSDRTVLFDQALLYVHGNSPQIGAMPWNAVDKIYGVGHVHGSHWFLYEVSIDDQMITIYDSKSQTLHWDVMVDELKYFSRNIPSLIRKSKFKRLRNGFPAPLKSSWELGRYKHPPQQINDADCGVLDLKYLECLLNGRMLSSIHPDRTHEYRKNFYAQLFEYGVKIIEEGWHN
ncbi:hypothetical protein C2S52_000246 [Perilla frutescens var. hirtella]|nr:hypothetical protein C2S52_000246 [Perilla frutescens var. hirtella]